MRKTHADKLGRLFANANHREGGRDYLWNGPRYALFAYSREISDIVQAEPVGHEHFTRSYVRGNWGNESRSPFFFLPRVASKNKIMTVPLIIDCAPCSVSLLSNTP